MKSFYVKMIALVVAGASFQEVSAQTEPAKPAEKPKEITTPAPAPVITEVAPQEIVAPVKEEKPVAAETTAPVPTTVAPAEVKKEKEKQKEKAPAIPPRK